MRLRRLHSGPYYEINPWTPQTEWFLSDKPFNLFDQREISYEPNDSVHLMDFNTRTDFDPFVLGYTLVTPIARLRSESRAPSKIGV
jgi:hypothetical protein